MIGTIIHGIPATVRVISTKYQKPDHRADSSEDYHGGWLIEYEICDRNGRPAPWLERKMSDEDHRRVEQEIIDGLHPAH